MILGMSTSSFTLFHVLLSLAGIASIRKFRPQPAALAARA
jgi:hypothetical protein